MKRKWILAACALLGAARAEAGVDFTPTLKVAAEERYDDDLLLRVETGSQTVGQMMTKLSAQAGFGVKDPSLTVTTWYAADFIVRHGSGNSTLDHRAAVSMKKGLTERLGVDVDMRVWRVTDPTALPRLGMAHSFSPILYGIGELSGHYRLSERWVGRVGYKFEGARIYEPGTTYGGYLHQPYVETTYDVTRRAQLGARYRVQFFSFGPQSADASALLAEFRYRFTPVTTLQARVGGAFFHSHRDTAETGTLPVGEVSLERNHEVLDLGLVLGHDLVGASGFTSALWADFASFIGAYRVQPRVQLFWAVSYYRNGRPPDLGLDPFGAEHAATGYALGGGVEWRVTRILSVQGAFNRIAQFGGPGGAGVGGTLDDAVLSRNIVSARLTLTAL